MQSFSRVIDDLGSSHAHTLVLCFAGIHGNEHEGVQAATQVFQTLRAQNIPLQGRFVALRGNMKALAENKRFLEEDLNRLWSDEFVHIARTHRHDHPEFEELAALCDAVEGLQIDNYRQRIFIDLHETSAENGIFTVVKDYTQSSFLVDRLHSPVVFNIHESLHNTTIQYMHEHGFIALAFEGGKIGNPNTVKNHRHILWQTLLHTELVRRADVPQEVEQYEELRAFSEKLPKYLKLDYCHKIREGDAFEMMPDFRNYDRIKRGDLLAHDRHREIRSQYDGFLLMPLYQKKGNDGFLIVSEVGADELARFQ